MSKLNPTLKKKSNRFSTEQLAGGVGALGAKQDAEAQLRRAVMSCLLFEQLFYETGDSNSENISSLIPLVKPEIVAQIAIEARFDQKLRHVPLYIIKEMARYNGYKDYVSELLTKIVTRADMITDFLSLYWKDGKKPLSAQIKKGLANTFHNFNEFQFAKYDRNSSVKLRDVMFLTRPKPQNQTEIDLFNKIANRNLTIPDTWEVELSKSTDKKASWTRLITENRVKALAFLRNLRNMKEAKVDHNVIKKGFESLSSQMLLPLNFLAARKYAPEFENEIENLMLKSYQNLAKLPGYSIFIVDVSGSMSGTISSRSQFSRHDACAAMALLASNQCEEIDIFCTAGNDSDRIHSTQKIDYPSKGFNLIDQIEDKKNSLGGGGIFTRQCLEYIQSQVSKTPDRIIIFSDSQDCDFPDKRTPKPFGKNNYIVDVSAHKYGINYKNVWTAEIAGWSDKFLTFIASLEGVNNQFNEEEN